MTSTTLDVSPPVVRFDRLRKQFRVQGESLTIIDDFSLSIHSGELVAIVGSSGCGKSTLLRMLVGLDNDYQGRVLVEGKTVRGIGRERGMVFQEPRLFPWLTVRQNIALGLANEAIDSKERKRLIDHFIQLVHLQDFADALPAQLSGGMAQRVAIARGLVANPRILMLDEPFGALDALTRQQMQQELRRIHQAEGTTTLLVTHDVEEAVYLADRVVVLAPRPGRIRQIATISLPHPRQRDSQAFHQQCSDLLALLTQPADTAADLSSLNT
ncbi:ABC transporter ATP-binding protein [Pectobacterium versatile]|uniref:ABC transporter ATP-binding protein n=1 Tax=Pectobacterium versatile TaxID=2488639 RepID=UPI001CE0F9B5|nr:MULTISPECIES: ABC transporter ATP-binding protein [Pectobacterium]MCA5931918.1 ABC transporter ATP-binding protein [Pectobacterium versatile]MCA5949753.1 ABC transporter ATP-binding protein [Pectobacterium versatile]MCA5953385.1 ABC transporter ATP-binding protein [Pectobacterium versatile]MCL6333474.1 ABC transporter ATP-binding protein [Pectobacterium carotovorum subsp. carotovorum]MCL6345306.1 ABC transporter ATP-binding protein [Pectobacterium carotovorum subsp. carotovorum]